MDDGKIDISGLDRAEVLAALYNASHPRGLGFLHAKTEPMTAEGARKELEARGAEPYFDYLHGRVMKIGFNKDDAIDPRLYDRDNGGGAAERAIGALRKVAP